MLIAAQDSKTENPLASAPATITSRLNESGSSDRMTECEQQLSRDSYSSSHHLSTRWLQLSRDAYSSSHHLSTRWLQLSRDSYSSSHHLSSRWLQLSRDSHCSSHHLSIGWSSVKMLGINTSSCGGFFPEFFCPISPIICNGKDPGTLKVLLPFPAKVIAKRNHPCWQVVHTLWVQATIQWLTNGAMHHLQEMVPQHLHYNSRWSSQEWRHTLVLCILFKTFSIIFPATDI